uniref:Uncharacterized protein n=1 Tax=Cucumis melo TaxID=3656 RepID=A0A9I9DCL0_CUCME
MSLEIKDVWIVAVRILKEGEQPQPVTEKVKETLVSRKDKAAKEKKNENYETAREMASKTVGEIGCRIREKTERLSCVMDVFVELKWRKCLILRRRNQV